MIARWSVEELLTHIHEQCDPELAGLSPQESLARYVAIEREMRLAADRVRPLVPRDTHVFKPYPGAHSGICQTCGYARSERLQHIAEARAGSGR